MQADKSTSRTLTAPRKPQRGLWGYVKVRCVYENALLSLILLHYLIDFEFSIE